MQLAKSTLLKWRRSALCLPAVVALFSMSTASAQGNSPYSRYGLGDLVPSSNVSTRGMGGISAAYVDALSVNFNNPASYAYFQVITEPRNPKKMAFGRVVLDAGVNVENRGLVDPVTTNKFSVSDAYFSYVQVGIPIRPHWGISFGLRPVSRIGYKINRFERLKDPVTGQNIDSSITQFNGNGGAFLPNIGTGFSIGRLSLGVNMGYLFGRREVNTTRSLINDTVSYYSAEYQANSSFGSLYYSAGMIYSIDLKQGGYLRLGASGNWKQNIKGSQDLIRGTYTLDVAGGNQTIDSVYERNEVKGEVVMPASYTGGFVIGNDLKRWQAGVDYSRTLWNGYRFFGQKDSVQDSWKISAGGQYRPKPASGYFSNVVYRAGFSYGRDYIRIKEALPVYTFSFGMYLPIRPSRMALNQANGVNVALEFVKRGNNNNVIKENMFRLSVGLNFTDLWFGKRKYD